AIRHWFSRQQSSFTASMRNLRDAPNVSDTKSNDPVDRQVVATNHREGALAWAQSHGHNFLQPQIALADHWTSGPDLKSGRPWQI
ncbi:MAG: hypothetical protein AB8B47_03480, partial [Roseobacter sp.]